jgi:Glycosyltransferase family 87
VRAAGEGRQLAWDRLAPGLVAVALGAAAALDYRRHGTDLEVYWRAARRLLAAEPLYRAADGLRTYRYAPGAALLFAPLAPLSYAAARAAWYGVLVALGALVARHLARQAGGALALVAFVGAARPLLDELHYAQANLLVLALLLGAFAAEDRGRDAAAGALVAVAAAVKLAPLVLAADLLLRRRWRAIAGFSGAALMLALAPAATLGLAGDLAAHRAWVASLGTSALGLAASPGNQSLLAAALRAGLPAWAGHAAAAGVVVLALARRDPGRRRPLLLLACALAAPLGWIWNFVLALPALLEVASRGRRWAAGMAAFGLAWLIPLYDVAGPRVERWVFERSLFTLAMAGLFALVLAAPSRNTQSV